MKAQVLLGRGIMRIRPALLAVWVKKLLRIRRFEYPTAEGVFWLDPASDFGMRLIRDGFYEPDMLATLKQWLRPGATFVDLGANEGYFAVAGSKCVEAEGRVLAIEPQARLRPVLERNFALNHCANVRIASVAVSDRSGDVVLHLAPEVNNSASSLIQPTRYAVSRQTTPSATLEEVLAREGVRECALLKIDIEGWEYEAVLGSPNLFKDGRVRAIALELHPNLLARRGLESGRITDFLASCGYKPQSGTPNLVLAR
jgi:FkbM family methyltransferase